MPLERVSASTQSVEDARDAFAYLDETAEFANVAQIVPERREKSRAQRRRRDGTPQAFDQCAQPVGAEVDGVGDDKVGALHLHVGGWETVAQRGVLGGQQQRQ